MSINQTFFTIEVLKVNAQEKVIKNKLGLLRLAQALGNVSQACDMLGYSRDSYYRFKELHETGGEKALQDISRKQPCPKNRVEKHVELAVLEYAVQQPAYGQLRVSNELRKQGICISSGGVRSVWLRYNLETFAKRLKALEAKMAQENLILTESQLVALERSREEKEAHGEIETEHPGYLLSQDTYFVGTIKGVGRVYQQTVIDTYSKVGFVKLYERKSAITAADMLNDKVIPWFEEQDVKILRILTDRGTEYCGCPDYHEYELYLTIEGIEHSKTKAYHPQTNGICERFNQTVQNEFYRVACRKKVYHSIEELQADLDVWIMEYNEQRTHTGKYCYGKTPMQTFLDTKKVAQDRVLESLHQTTTGVEN